ncbi:hypothetical protein GCM10009692_24410 [Leucobacter aridicollis]
MCCTARHSSPTVTVVASVTPHAPRYPFRRGCVRVRLLERTRPISAPNRCGAAQIHERTTQASPFYLFRFPT